MRNFQIADGKIAGVLSLQGDFSLHRKILNDIGVETIEVRKIEELDKITNLIIPGGESTTLLKFFKDEDWFKSIIEFSKKKPVMGTCAGAILISEKVENPEQESLKLIPMKIRRNGYGRQISSFISEIEEHSFGGNPITAVFIRAPRIISLNENVKVLAKYKGEPVAVLFERHIALTFHPELTDDLRIHKYFLSL